MNEIESLEGRKVAVAIIQTASKNEQETLSSWLEKLMHIGGSDLTSAQKIKAAMQCTYESKAAWPIVKIMAAQIRKHGWDNRGSRTRWATVASAVGIVTFGGQSAGIVALGGAIGVPLWVVLGGGAAFAKVILDELQANSLVAKNHAKSPIWEEAVTVIDGEYLDITNDSDRRGRT